MKEEGEGERGRDEEGRLHIETGGKYVDIPFQTPMHQVYFTGIKWFIRTRQNHHGRGNERRESMGGMNLPTANGLLLSARA